MRIHGRISHHGLAMMIHILLLKIHILFLMINLLLLMLDILLLMSIPSLMNILMMIFCYHHLSRRTSRTTPTRGTMTNPTMIITQSP